MREMDLDIPDPLGLPGLPGIFFGGSPKQGASRCFKMPSLCLSAGVGHTFPSEGGPSAFHSSGSDTQTDLVLQAFCVQVWACLPGQQCAGRGTTNAPELPLRLGGPTRETQHRNPE